MVKVGNFLFVNDSVVTPDVLDVSNEKGDGI